MSKTEIEHLIKMVNQIADNILPAVEGEDCDLAARKVADHILRFWAPSMRQKIGSYAQTDGKKLQPISKAAIVLLSVKVTD